MNRLDIRHSVHGSELSLLLVIVDQRLGLGVIGLKPRAHHFLGIVAAANELGRAATVAYARNLGHLVILVIALAAISAGEAAGDPLDERLVVHAHLDHGIELLATRGE